MNSKNFKVELIGGPLCGLIQDWPNETPFMIFEKSHCRYELEEMREDGTYSAIYKGFTE